MKTITIAMVLAGALLAVATPTAVAPPVTGVETAVRYVELAHDRIERETGGSIPCFDRPGPC